MRDYKIISEHLGTIISGKTEITIKPEKGQKLFLAEKDDIEYFILVENEKIVKEYNIAGIMYVTFNFLEEKLWKNR